MWKRRGPRKRRLAGCGLRDGVVRRRECSESPHSTVAGRRRRQDGLWQRCAGAWLKLVLTCPQDVNEAPWPESVEIITQHYCALRVAGVRRRCGRRRCDMAAGGGEAGRSKFFKFFTETSSQELYQYTCLSRSGRQYWVIVPEGLIGWEGVSPSRETRLILF